MSNIRRRQYVCTFFLYPIARRQCGGFFFLSKSTFLLVNKALLPETLVFRSLHTRVNVITALRIYACVYTWFKRTGSIYITIAECTYGNMPFFFHFFPPFQNTITHVHYAATHLPPPSRGQKHSGY